MPKWALVQLLHGQTKLDIILGFFLPPKRPVLVSAHAQSFFSGNWAKQTQQEKANCSAPKTVTGLTTLKFANKRYIQLCGKDSM